MFDEAIILSDEVVIRGNRTDRTAHLSLGDVVRSLNSIETELTPVDAVGTPHLPGLTFKLLFFGGRIGFIRRYYGWLKS